MNPLETALHGLDVVNFQIDQYLMRQHEVPQVLLDQRTYYEAEAASLQVARPVTTWRTYQRPACEITQEEAEFLNSPYCHPAIDA